MSVGIVIVSHSQRLAEGTAELARQMAQGGVTIATAGGTDNGEIGTSLQKVSAALQEAAGSDGTLILLDLGSAVMTTEIALELLDDEQRQKTLISSAPLVEGAILAAVEAAAGSNLEEVAHAAEEAYAMPKVQHEL